MSVHTGMRLSEQYTCTWSQVHLDRRTIELTKTKNGSARTVHLNSDAVEAIESLTTAQAARIRSGLPARRQQEQLRHPLMVPSLHGGCRHQRLRMALQPAHVLLMAGDGRGEHQGNSGSGRTQVDHDVGAV